MRNNAAVDSICCCIACGKDTGDFHCPVKLNRAGVPVPTAYETGLYVCGSCADDFAKDEPEYGDYDV